MNVLELEEAEGLTDEQVHDYLRRNGWRWVEHEPGSFEYRNTDDNSVFLGGITRRSESIAMVARLERRSPQALLRAINPRMRKGIPSSDAIRAHYDAGGYWLASSPGKLLRVGFFDQMLRFRVHTFESTATCSDLDNLHLWTFWPCDANGNKVPWPTESANPKAA